MVYRVFVIVLAPGAGAYRVATGAVPEGIGLFAMAAGLVFLQMARDRPRLKMAAFASFAVTGAIIAYVLYRNSQ